MVFSPFVFMSCRPPLTLADYGVFDVAKIHIFPDITRKRNPRRPEGGRGEAPRGWFIENPYGCNDKTKKALPNSTGLFSSLSVECCLIIHGELDRCNIEDCACCSSI